MQRRSSDEQSVGLSVCRLNCNKTKETSAHILIPYKKVDASSFATRRLVGGDVLSYLKRWAKLTHPVENGDFQSIFFRSASAVIANVQLSLIGSSLRTFQ